MTSDRGRKKKPKHTHTQLTRHTELLARRKEKKHQRNDEVQVNEENECCCKGNHRQLSVEKIAHTFTYEKKNWKELIINVLLRRFDRNTSDTISINNFRNWSNPIADAAQPSTEMKSERKKRCSSNNQIVHHYGKMSRK